VFTGILNTKSGKLNKIETSFNHAYKMQLHLSYCYYDVFRICTAVKIPDAIPRRKTALDKKLASKLLSKTEQKFTGRGEERPHLWKINTIGFASRNSLRH